MSVGRRPTLGGGGAVQLKTGKGNASPTDDGLVEEHAPLKPSPGPDLRQACIMLRVGA